MLKFGSCVISGNPLQWKLEQKNGSKPPGKHPAPPESAQGAIFDGAFFVRRIRLAAISFAREGWGA